jgi:ATPase subunit of ABC transporter with duplicated ATPase domains
LLLLDEPTNHLDLDALVWLETWLKKYEGTMVVISHDREFLDAMTNVTLHIDAAKLVRYGGNYSKFEDMRAEQMALQAERVHQAAGQNCTPAKIHRALQGQGQQSQAGAKPREGTWTAWKRSPR